MQATWNLREPAPNSFVEAHQEYTAPVANMLYNRGLRTQEAIDEFLSPDYSVHVHDPFLFVDMHVAVARIMQAIEAQEHMVIHGDYDADGVCASTILAVTFRALGAKHVDAFLPHRETDGYGLNMNTVDLLHKEGNTLMITCDCGVSNTAEIAHAQSLGMDVIVTDHHAIPETLPPATAIIHPKLERESYPDQTLCGAAVAFKLVQGLLRTHKEQHDLINDMTHEAFEKWLLDLVAIATVADMVPLRGESRTFTKYGLIVLKKTRRIGLEKLLLEAKLKHNDGSLERIDEDTIGFKIAPMINAAGRLHHANVAYNLLTTEDPIAAVDLAYELKSNNQDRKKITDKFVAEAIEQVEATQQDKPVLLVKSHDWTTGVVGLIASRLKAEYHKPTVAIAWNGDAITGSGRSIPGFNMVEAIQGMPELFTKFGGHPMACGFTLVDEAALAQFQDRLIDAYYEATRGAVLEKTIDIETELTLEDINWDLYDELVQFEPFGKENPKPLYLVRGATVKEVKALGKSQSHLALFLTQHTPKIKKFIGWRMCSTSTGTNWCTTLKPGDRVDVVFDIGINEWNGNRDLQCIIQDLRISND